MKQQVSKAIVLARTNYGEADRIITVLTPTDKHRLLAKGVRKVRSKLAGGVELFSVSELVFLQGRGQLQTLISSRLITHYANIVKDIDRTTFAYDVLKKVNKITEDSVDAEYFELLVETLAALDDMEVPLVYVRLWFYVRLLKLGGHAPNLKHGADGGELAESAGYVFSFEDMAFRAKQGAPFQVQHIKFLRLAFMSGSPRVLAKVQGAEPLAIPLEQLLKTALNHWHLV